MKIRAKNTACMAQKDTPFCSIEDSVKN